MPNATIESTRPVLLVTDDEALAPLIANLRVVRCYPDTTDAAHQWVEGGTFKIEIAKAPKASD